MKEYVAEGKVILVNFKNLLGCEIHHSRRLLLRRKSIQMSVAAFGFCTLGPSAGSWIRHSSVSSPTVCNCLFIYSLIFLIRNINEDMVVIISLQYITVTNLLQLLVYSCLLAVLSVISIQYGNYPSKRKLVIDQWMIR